MLKVLPGDVYYSSQTIIFNPVSPSDSEKGFLRKVKILYPSVYNKYRVYIGNSSEIRLGDILLVYIGDYQFMLNGFCIDKHGELDELALCTNLVELYNIADEYELSVGIQSGLFVADPEEQYRTDIITKVIFEDNNPHIDAHLYNMGKDILT